MGQRVNVDPGGTHDREKCGARVPSKPWRGNGVVLHPTRNKRCCGLSVKTFHKTPRLAGDRQRKSYSQRANAILSERDQHLATIRRLRQKNDASHAFAAKALLLLTRGWAPANWTARAELLRAAGWLLQLQHLQDRDGRRTGTPLAPSEHPAQDT
jgi:hypothetical protein